MDVEAIKRIMAELQPVDDRINVLMSFDAAQELGWRMPRRMAQRLGRQFRERLRRKESDDGTTQG